jgi:hypothetical protein
MRKRGLAAMMLLAVATAGCSASTGGVGSAAPGSGGASTPTSPDFPSTTPGPSSAAAATAPSSSAGAPTVAQRAARLTAQTNGEAHVIVSVPGGYEAATYTQAGAIEFWHDPPTSTTWQQIGQSTYPYDAQLGTPPDARVRGALLAGMTHATFIVHGTFTTDGGGNAVAFTTGSKGWGAIKAEPNGNIGPSGQPVGSNKIGLTFDVAFADGKLQTKDCPTNRPIADCAGHPVTKLWAWTGHDFRLA